MLSVKKSYKLKIFKVAYFKLFFIKKIIKKIKQKYSSDLKKNHEKTLDKIILKNPLSYLIIIILDIIDLKNA